MSYERVPGEDQLNLALQLHNLGSLYNELGRYGDAEPVLRGRFCPHPNVWTGFMAVYGILGMIGLSALMYGGAQLVYRMVDGGYCAASDHRKDGQAVGF